MAQKNSFVKMPKRNIRVLSRIHKKYPRRLGDRGGFPLVWCFSRGDEKLCVHLWDVSVHGRLLCDVKDDKNQLCQEHDAVVAEPYHVVCKGEVDHGDQTQGEYG